MHFYAHTNTQRHIHAHTHTHSQGFHSYVLKILCAEMPHEINF